jgi:hypothetical protein
MKKLCLAFTLAIFALSARANTIVFNTFGPSDSFDPFNTYVVGDFAGLPFFYTAAQFTAQASGNLATVEFPLAAGEGIAPPLFPILNVYLYPDLGGSPDSAHAIFLGTEYPADQPNFFSCIA